MLQYLRAALRWPQGSDSEERVPSETRAEVGKVSRKRQNEPTNRPQRRLPGQQSETITWRNVNTSKERTWHSYKVDQQRKLDKEGPEGVGWTGVTSRGLSWYDHYWPLVEGTTLIVRLWLLSIIQRIILRSMGIKVKNSSCYSRDFHDLFNNRDTFV